MTAISTRLSIAQPNDPVVHPAWVRRLAGASLLLPRTEFDLGVSEDRARIASGGITNGIYPDGQILHVVGEPAPRRWVVGTGVDNAAIAAASDARTVVLRPGLTVRTGSDGASVLSATGAPLSGTGSDGDVAVDYPGNAYYVKTTGSWGVGTAIYAGAAAGGSTVVGFSTVIPLDGMKVMEPIMASVAPLAFTLQAASARVAGSECLMRIVANGVDLGGPSGGPTFTGALPALLGGTWDNSAGVANLVRVRFDGSEAYLYIDQSSDEDPHPYYGGSAVSTNTVTLNLAGQGVSSSFVPAPGAFSLSTRDSGGTLVTDTVTAVAVPSANSVVLTKSRANVAGDTVTVGYQPPASNALVGATTGKRAYALRPTAITSAAFLLDSLGVAAGNGLAYSTRKLRAAYAGPALRLQRIDGASANVGSPFDVPFNTAGELDLSVNAVLAAGGGNLTAGHKLMVLKLYNQMSSGTAFDLTPQFGPIANLKWKSSISKWVMENTDTPNMAFKISPAGLAAQQMSATTSGAVAQYTVAAVALPYGTQPGAFGAIAQWNPTSGTGQARLQVVSTGTSPSTLVSSSSLVDDAQTANATVNLPAASNALLKVVTSRDATSATARVNNLAEVTDNATVALTAAASNGLSFGGQFVPGGFQGFAGEIFELIMLPFASDNARRAAIIGSMTAYWGS